MNNAALASYARALIATTLTATLTVLNSEAELNWKVYGTTVLVAIIPVLLRALDPNDQAFGRTRK